jgi:hypothetical protein
MLSASMAATCILSLPRNGPERGDGLLTTYPRMKARLMSR